jgi:hypothetical protein
MNASFRDNTANFGIAGSEAANPLKQIWISPSSARIHVRPKFSEDPIDIYNGLSLRNLCPQHAELLAIDSA